MVGQARLDFNFTDEQELFRRTVREFAQKEVAPKIREYERKGQFPWEIYRKMGKAGLLGLRLPKEYGGQEADATAMAIAVEELARPGLQTPQRRHVFCRRRAPLVTDMAAALASSTLL